MKILISIILTLFSFSFLAHTNTMKVRKDIKENQDKNESKKHHLFEYTTIGFNQKFFQHGFQNQLKSSSKIEFNSLPVNSISMSIINYIPYYSGTFGNGSFPGFIGYNYIIPTQVTIGKNSIQTLSGYNLNLSLAGQTIINSPNFGFFITEGLRFGRLKLKDENRVRIKNPINAIFVASVLRVSYSNFSIFATVQYDFDFSPKRWRKMWFYKAQEIEIPDFNQSGLEFRVGINFSLNKHYQIIHQ